MDLNEAIEKRFSELCDCLCGSGRITLNDDSSFSPPSSRFIHMFPSSLVYWSRCCEGIFRTKCSSNFFAMYAEEWRLYSYAPPHTHGVNVYKSMTWRNEWIKSENTVLVHRTHTESIVAESFRGKRCCWIRGSAQSTYVFGVCVHKLLPMDRVWGMCVCNVNKLCVKCKDFKCLLEVNVNRRSTEPAAWLKDGGFFFLSFLYCLLNEACEGGPNGVVWLRTYE